MRVKPYHSLNCPACSCVSITFPASTSLRRVVSNYSLNDPLAREAQVTGPLAFPRAIRVGMTQCAWISTSSLAFGNAIGTFKVPPSAIQEIRPVISPVYGCM
jgi:hypothetical protein